MLRWTLRRLPGTVSADGLRLLESMSASLNLRSLFSDNECHGLSLLPASDIPCGSIGRGFAALASISVVGSEEKGRDQPRYEGRRGGGRPSIPYRVGKEVDTLSSGIGRWSCLPFPLSVDFERGNEFCVR
jgi:hypothetical protein